MVFGLKSLFGGKGAKSNKSRSSQSIHPHSTHAAGPDDENNGEPQISLGKIVWNAIQHDVTNPEWRPRKKLPKGQVPVMVRKKGKGTGGKDKEWLEVRDKEGKTVKSWKDGVPDRVADGTWARDRRGRAGGSGGGRSGRSGEESSRSRSGTAGPSSRGGPGSRPPPGAGSRNSSRRRSPLRPPPPAFSRPPSPPPAPKGARSVGGSSTTGIRSRRSSAPFDENGRRPYCGSDCSSCADRAEELRTKN